VEDDATIQHERCKILISTQVIKCHRAWKLFDGNSEHYTMPFRAAPGKAAPTRISIVAFSHSSYNKMPEETAREMKALGFTAGSSDGKELPYFEAFRIDKSELTGEGLDAYLAVWKSTSAPGAILHSFLGDDAAVLVRSSGEEPASPRH